MLEQSRWAFAGTVLAQSTVALQVCATATATLTVACVVDTVTGEEEEVVEDLADVVDEEEEETALTQVEPLRT